MLMHISRKPTAIIVRGTAWFAFHPVKFGQSMPIPQFFIPAKESSNA